MSLLPALTLLVACSGNNDSPAPEVRSPTPEVGSPVVAPAPEATPAAVPVKPGLYLQSLVVTSGESALALLDDKTDDGWSPLGEPENEGVLFRFEDNTSIARIEVTTCKNSPGFVAAFYVDGTEVTDGKRLAGGGLVTSFAAAEGQARSVFFRVAQAQGRVCIAEVAFFDKKPLLVNAPRAAKGTINASSTLEPIDAYHSAYLFDGRTGFGWVEGGEGNGIGESLQVVFDQPVAQVTSLELWNGYQRSEDHFKKNARARKLELTIDGGTPIQLAATDTQGPQKLDLEKPTDIKQFTLKINSAWEGTKYKDLVLSELRLWDAHGPLTVTTPDGEQRQQALQKSVANTPLAS
ncbi:MAG: hypothetical protein HN348_19265, partial [Proteobacteria bacterium]|nr:hypothetical protein [Pseudomonadota bacterium]